MFWRALHTGTAHLIFHVRSKFVSLEPFRETERVYFTEPDARGTLFHDAENELVPISPDFQAWLIHLVRIHTGHEHPMSLISPMESQDEYYGMYLDISSNVALHKTKDGRVKKF